VREMIIRQFNYPFLDDVLRQQEQMLDGLHFDNAKKCEIIAATNKIASIKIAIEVGEEYEPDF